ncbi:MAG: PQQ-binding-like beta-propeller repeat protein [Pseudomonadota bacterium]
MPKLRIKASDIVKDVRAGCHDPEIMEKYGLPPAALQDILTKLVNAGLLDQSDLNRRMISFEATVNIEEDFLEAIKQQEVSHRPPQRRPKPVINGRQVLNDIEQGLTDGRLMEKYRLSARGLQSLYTKMINAGLLNRADIEARMKHRESTVTVDIKPVPMAELKWRFPVGDVAATPLVFGNTVYFGSWDGHLYAVNLETGEEIWRFKTKGPVHACPALTDGSLCFGSGDNYLYCVDSHNGTLRWRYRTGGPVYSTPTIAYGVVYFGSNDDCLYAVDLESGLLVWKFMAGGPVYSGPAVSGGIVCFGCDDKNLYALDIAQGGFSVSAWQE